MKIAFLGDIHGRIFHALTVLVKWQKVHKQKFDLIIQAGDFGAYPYPDDELLNNRFVQQDPTELDFSRFMAGGGIIDEFNNFVKSELSSPVYFIRGNHEDFNWLDSLITDNGISQVDEKGLLNYIKDGTVKVFGDVKIAFLGGAEFGAKAAGVLDMNAYVELMESKEKKRIREEELFRYEVRESLESPRTKYDKVLGFLNSGVGLWLLSTVSVSAITTLYTWSNNHLKQAEEKRILEERLTMEINARIAQWTALTSHLKRNGDILPPEQFRRHWSILL
ncbi:MAG: metallophosphoesterase, partial [Clostridia bacterium]|nr:metallophosphoesterase [Clostridia bacterium]